ncbi:MAG: AAA family ATPase [Candidatus Komeilibacteria bacterium]|nr:AAA family ATPase [Candidatus Komeilibacteria bacterium]
MRKKRTKVIFIFGPMASGKYTIGRRLSKITGYPLWHNHVFTKTATALMGGKKYSIHDKEFYNQIGKLRTFCLQNIADLHEGIIMTGVYAPGSGDRYVSRLMEINQKGCLDYFFVQLKCPLSKLLDRVTNSSRKRFDRYKIRTKKELISSLARRDILANLPVKCLVIDTGKTTIVESADRILRYSKRKRNSAEPLP